jgi:RecA-family ATPase
MIDYPPEDSRYADTLMAPQPVPDDPYADVPHTADRTDAPSTTTPQTTAGVAVVLCVADVTAERVEWLWEGRIARGKLTVIDGDPGQGKSTLTTDLAARLSTGTPLPGGQRTTPAAVVLLSAEDGVGDTIRPRLEAAGADVRRVFVFDSVMNPDGTQRPPSIPLDLAMVEALVVEQGAVLIVIDPLMAFLGSGVDAHRD